MRRKKPKYSSAEQAKLDRELKASWVKVLAKHPTNGLRPPAQPLPDYKGLVQKRQRGQQVPSKGIDPVAVPRLRPALSVEMQEREKAAQEEIERKKKRTAPAYNKGGLQYISNPEDFKTMGRKV